MFKLALFMSGDWLPGQAFISTKAEDRVRRVCALVCVLLFAVVPFGGAG